MQTINLKGGNVLDILHKIVNNLLSNPRDLQTIPLNKKGLWFYAYVNNGNIYVSKARIKTPSSKLVSPQRLNINEMNEIFSIYNRRMNGEKVSCEATKVTRHQVYWYSIFHNCL